MSDEGLWQWRYSPRVATGRASHGKLLKKVIVRNGSMHVLLGVWSFAAPFQLAYLQE